MKLVLGWLAVLSGSTLAAQSAVYVVDPANGAGTDFTSLSAAVSAAASGDVLLLRTGNHPAITLDGKGLTLLEDTGASVTVDQLTVRNLPAGASAIARGLTFDSGPSTAEALHFQDCAGTVWLEGCSVQSASNEDCVTVLDCAEVLFVDCQVYGHPGPSCTSTGAIAALRSNLYVFGGRVRGVDGYTGSFPFHFEIDGQAAVRSEEGSVWLQGTDLRGGDGGWNFNPSDCLGCSDGAPALVLRGVAPTASILDSALQGGFGGVGYCGPNGQDAPDIDAPPGSVQFLGPHARRIATPSPVRGGHTTTLTASGQPGDRVVLVLAQGARPGLFGSAYVGALLVGSPHSSLYFGTVGPGGTLTLSLGPVALSAGVEGLGFFVQGLFLNGALHENVWSNPTHVVLLDPSL